MPPSGAAVSLRRLDWVRGRRSLRVLAQDLAAIRNCVVVALGAELLGGLLRDLLHRNCRRAARRLPKRAIDLARRRRVQLRSVQQLPDGQNLNAMTSRLTR